VNLLRVYYQPLKLLFIISPTSLHNTLENVTRTRYDHFVSKLEVLLSEKHDPTLVQLVSTIKKQIIFNLLLQLEGNQLTSSLMAIVKWSLISNGNVAATHFKFDLKDVNVLISHTRSLSSLIIIPSLLVTSPFQLVRFLEKLVT